MRALPARTLIVLMVAAAGAGLVSWASRESSVVEPSAGGTPPEPANVPFVRIDVAGETIGNDSRVPGTLEIITGNSGDAAPLKSRIGIELHGASTLVLPKKSYDVELWDDSGDERALPLLGLPAHTDWVLHGCGRDDTCLRNALAYALARDLGHYAPRTRFVELFVDNQHQGLYVLVERIRRDPERVDLPRPAGEAESGDITGGYIFKMDMAEGHPADKVPRDWVSPVSSLVYSYHYPRYDDITSAQQEYLHDHMAAFERVMLGDGWNAPDSGYRAWIDVRSWVDFALLQELSYNIDAYQKSHYFQKWPRSRGDRMALGPIWDFDSAFGSTDVREGRRTDVWAHQMNRFGAGDPVPYDPPGRVPHVPAYWERLWSDPAFLHDLHCRWEELRQGPLHLDRINGRIERWTEELARAQPRDDARWEIGEAYDARIGRLKAWLAARLAWIDVNLPRACTVTP